MPFELAIVTLYVMLKVGGIVVTFSCGTNEKVVLPALPASKGSESPPTNMSIFCPLSNSPPTLIRQPLSVSYFLFLLRYKSSMTFRYLF